MRPKFQLTEKQLKKCEIELRAAKSQREYADTNKAKLGKRYPMACRDAGRTMLKADPEYQLGLWQGRIDNANGLGYSDERLSKSYNMGYHTGYTSYESNKRGGLVIPVQYLSSEA